MSTPLATIIKLFVHPQFDVVDGGRVRTVIPLMRRAGAHSGTLPTPGEIDHDTTGVAFLWTAQIYRVIPAVTKISYDTAAARVDIYFDEARTDAKVVIVALNRLVGVAIDTIDKFLVCDKRELRSMARRFDSELERIPIELSRVGSAERLRRAVERVLTIG